MASSRTSFPPGLSTLANSARVSELWTEELSARRQESTKSKLDAEWDAEKSKGREGRGKDHFTPDFNSFPLVFNTCPTMCEPTSHFYQNCISDDRINYTMPYCTVMVIRQSSHLQLCDSVK